MTTKYLLRDDYNDELVEFPTKEEMEDHIKSEVERDSDCVDYFTVYEVFATFDVDVDMTPKLKRRKGE